MKSYSLTRRIIGMVVLAQILCALFLCGAVLLHEQHGRRHALDVELQGRSDSLLGAIQDAEDPNDNVRIDPAELKLPTRDVYAVYNGDGALLGTSLNAPAALIARGSDGFRDVQVHGDVYRVLQRNRMRIIDRDETGGVGLKRPVTILYASPERHVWHEIFESTRYFLLLTVIAAMVTAALVAVCLRRALRPLSELAIAAARVSAPSLVFSAPPAVMQVRELQPLAEVLAGAMARLRESFAKEQRFVGDAAHELKTAVAVVRSSVQLLMMRRRTEGEYSAGLQRILEDNCRVEALVAQMLQLAAVEGNQETVAVHDLHLSVERAVEHLQPVAQHHAVDLRLESSPGMPVRLPPERAYVLVSNLLLNAIQHSHPGQSASVSLERHTPEHVVLRVADTGEGIAPDALPHIFERFFREDRSRSRSTGGTGLGLAICKTIVESAGGQISVHSEKQAGTEVVVTFMQP